VRSEAPMSLNAQCTNHML